MPLKSALLPIDMDPNLLAALGQTDDVKLALLRAVAHADRVIRRSYWRGFRPTVSVADHAVSAADRTADDFVAEAYERLLNGKRTYDPSLSLLGNLNSVTDSIISSYKKSSDRVPLVDYAISHGEDGRPIDPITNSREFDDASYEPVSAAENKAAQRQAFDSIRAHFSDSADMQAYLDAMAEGFFLPREIAEVTDLSAERVSELRRTARNHAKILFGVRNFMELKRKMET